MNRAVRTTNRQFRSLLTGAPINLTGLKLLARGGEAEVFTLPSRPDLLFKRYKEVSPARTARVRAMLQSPPSQDPHQPLIAWPTDAVWSAPKSEILGVLVPYGRNTLTLLDLMVPKLRYKKCPNVDARFLARVAYNLAIAVHQVHNQGHIIGDLNELNILVRSNGTVLLIDADSFQISSGRSVHPCLVGRPEYTPPELFVGSQGKLGRTRVHDYFGLAVLIFQILMHSRHPFDGRDDWVFTIEERIKKGRFPHAVPPAPGVLPPPDAKLSMLPGVLGRMFLAAFVDGHMEPYARPNAMAWATVLKGVEPLLASL